MKIINPIQPSGTADLENSTSPAAIGGKLPCQQQDRRRLLVQAREMKWLVTQLEQVRQEAQNAIHEQNTLRQQMVAQAAAFEERLLQIEQSRGFRLVRLYADAYHVPVLGVALRRLRRTAGRMMRFVRHGR